MGPVSLEMANKLTVSELGQFGFFSFNCLLILRLILLRIRYTVLR